jgi:GAF domain-containing protein
VPSHEDARARVAELRQQSADQLVRAARAGQIARKYEGLLDSPPSSLRPLRERMAQLHRRLEVRHLESARLQDLYAARLEVWSTGPEPSQVRPMFIDAVASAIGVPSAAVVMRNREGLEVFAATSDRTARLAHDLEFVVGEGPTGDVSASVEPIRVSEETLRTRWLRFGPMVIEQGVRAVVGVPLRQEPGDCLGALCVYTPQPVVKERVVTASTRVADALTHTVLNLPGSIADDQADSTSLFDEAAFHATVNQAAGIVSVHSSCDPNDALALLRARAFADGTPVEALAESVVRGEVRL